MNARDKTVAGGITITIVIAIVVWSVLIPPEPTYGGKPLTAWAEQYGSNHWSNVDRAADREAEFAIRRIGTKAIPFLLDLIQAKDSILKKRLRSLVPQKWHQRLGIDGTSGQTRRIGAHGLAALGTNAPTAVPTLIEFANRHPDEDGRYIAFFALRTLGLAAESAIPLFIQGLTNDVSIIRDEAAICLGGMHHRPEIVVPNLIQYLKFAKSSSSSFECTDAVGLLGKFGTNAKASVPIMIELLEHSNPSVRLEATNWLPRIDPEAAANAQVKRAW